MKIDDIIHLGLIYLSYLHTIIIIVIFLLYWFFVLPLISHLCDAKLIFINFIMSVYGFNPIPPSINSKLYYVILIHLLFILVVFIFRYINLWVILYCSHIFPKMHCNYSKVFHIPVSFLQVLNDTYLNHWFYPLTIGKNRIHKLF